MQTVLLVIHLFVAIALIGAILLQRSEGGALGIGGGGNGGNIFSARGVGNGLTRATAILAAIFFLTSIGLTVLATRHGKGGSSIFDNQPATSAPAGNSEGQGSGTAPNLIPNLGQQTAPAQAPAAPAQPAAPATPQVPTNN